MSVSNPEFSESSLLRPVVISRGDHPHKKGASVALMFAAIGVVFGDIGTSPLYALKECFSAEHGIPFQLTLFMALFQWCSGHLQLLSL